jgi:hypothetical protein
MVPVRLKFESVKFKSKKYLTGYFGLLADLIESYYCLPRARDPDPAEVLVWAILA